MPNEAGKLLVEVVGQQLAEVRIGPAIKRGEGAAQGKPAVILSIQKQPDANRQRVQRRG